MKIKLFVAAAATVVASSAMAQSAFEGFYGQLATGYEGNQASSLNQAGVSSGNANENWTTSNQSFGGAPLVVGLGYNASVAKSWLLGIGVDYSALNQTSSTFSSTGAGASASNGGASLNNQKLETSQRYNIFVTPGYVLDKDKLVYLKAGYSSVNLRYTGPTSASSASGSTNYTFSNPSNTMSGYILGLGYKQMITSGFYGFAEANYMSYSSSSFSSSVANSSSNYKLTFSPTLKTYQALVGVGYKF
jgi:hypothetical protein